MTPAEQLRPFAYRSAAGATLIISVETIFTGRSRARDSPPSTSLARSFAF